MNKSKFVPLLLSLAVVVGCSDKSQEGRDVSGTTQSASAPAEKGFKATPLASPLPNGMKIPFRYHVRDDRRFDLDGGKKERRIVVDALDGDAKFVQRKLTVAFEKAGYHAGRSSPYRKGERISYRRQDGQRVSVTVWSSRNRKPIAPGAQAVVYFGWPMPSGATN